MARRGRPPHPGPLTPAEDRVLEHVKQGLPNAEIAVRLGISVNTVRYHVSNLLAKANATTRDDLARWQPKEEGRRWRWGWLSLGWKPAAVGVATVGLLSLGAMVYVPVADNAQTAETAVDPSDEFTVPDPDELRARGFFDAGQVLDREGNTVVLGHSMRDVFSRILIADPEGIEITPLAHDQPYTFSLLSVSPSPLAVTQVFITDAAGMPHRSTLTQDGHLWIQTEPLPGDVVYDWASGWPVTMSGAQPLGELPVGPGATELHRTTCIDGRCEVYYHLTAGTALQPFRGTPTCDSSTHWRLASAVATIHVEPNLIGDPPPDVVSGCAAVETEAGVPWLNPGAYRLTATDSAGRPISLGITPDGHLYAGKFAVWVD